MKIDKNIIYNILLALALFFLVQGIMQFILVIIQIAAYNVGTSSVIVSKMYRDYAMGLSITALTGLCGAAFAVIFGLFKPGRIIRIASVAACGAVLVMLIVLFSISGLNVPYMSYNSYPFLIDYADYGMITSMQSILMSSMLPVGLLLTCTLLGRKRKEQSAQPVIAEAEKPAASVPAFFVPVPAPEPAPAPAPSEENKTI